MSDHQCPYIGSLATCPDHPKWHVIKLDDRNWDAYPERARHPEETARTWREAFDYAYDVVAGDVQ